MARVIQRVELNTFCRATVHCPFCGSQVLDAHPADETLVTPCTHTLFVAHDDGLEYRSGRFDENLGLQGIGSDEIAAHLGSGWHGVDALTDRVTVPDAVKVAAYVGAATGFGSYYGFAPVDGA